MMLRKRNGIVGRAAAMLGVATAFVLVTAGVAVADTSQAAAQAVNIQLLGGQPITTGAVEASNDGSTETVSGNPTPGLELLVGQTLLSAGVLVQQATAEDDGTSAACAGVVGPGGAIQIGDQNDCTATIGTIDGVVVTLPPPNAVLVADAIFAECTASSDGTTTGSATLVNAALGDAPLNFNPPPNTTVNGLTLATLVLNEQTVNPDGSLTVVALHLTLLPALPGAPLADLRLGIARCGPNAVTDPIPMIPLEGLPYAGAGLAVMGTAGYLVYRHRRQAGAIVAGA